MRIPRTFSRPGLARNTREKDSPGSGRAVGAPEKRIRNSRKDTNARANLPARERGHSKPSALCYPKSDIRNTRDNLCWPQCVPAIQEKGGRRDAVRCSYGVYWLNSHGGWRTQRGNSIDNRGGFGGAGPAPVPASEAGPPSDIECFDDGRHQQNSWGRNGGERVRCRRRWLRAARARTS